MKSPVFPAESAGAPARTGGDPRTGPFQARHTRVTLGHALPLPLTRSPALHGRDAEQDALLRLLDAARDGSGGALILRGARGTGKTAMLDVAAERAGESGDFVVLRVRGSEAESHLPCAGLHGLLRPIADQLPALPPAQAAALARALELGAVDGGLALPAAVLNLLVAAGGPVLACVDDVHHLDAPSREALFFAARRLTGEGVALLLGADDGTAVPDDIPAFELDALDREAAGRLAGDLVPGLTDDEWYDELNSSVNTDWSQLAVARLDGEPVA
ncbi:BREX system ATP-binding domain-containing protein, partial [Streptosporangium sp. NPDC001682]